MRGRVTAGDARELDRAMLLLQKGRISYGRWVETLAAWARGEDVSDWDYGDAEPISERVERQFRGMVVENHVIQDAYGLTDTWTAHMLARMSRRGMAEKVGYGRWRIGRKRVAA